ncbi:MAG: hypothetical protein L6Q71_02575, partial [Planctomycetes bacterium]|nr:hypothetical protein [Planctomycetota bacterium]
MTKTTRAKSIIREAGWLLGLPATGLALSSRFGLGETAADVALLVLTFAAGFVAPVQSPRKFEPYFWQGGLSRLLSPALGGWLTVIVLGGQLELVHGLWFLALTFGWYGVSSLFVFAKALSGFRVAIVGTLNVLLCSTPFWSNGVLQSLGNESRATATQWLVWINPVLTAAEGFSGVNLLEAPLMYMQHLSLLSDYSGRVAPA